MVYHYLFGLFYLSKLLFSGFIQIKGYFVRDQNAAIDLLWDACVWIVASFYL